MVRYWSLLIYALFTIVIVGLFNYSDTSLGSTPVESYIFPLTGAATVAVRTGMIMFWISLLPAWLVAVRMRTDVTRYFLLLAGYLVFFAPVWFTAGEAETGNEALFRMLSYVSAVLLAGAATVALKRFQPKG